MLRSMLFSLVMISAPLSAKQREYGSFKILDLVLSKPASGPMFDERRGVAQDAYLVVENNSNKTIFPDGRPHWVRVAGKTFAARFYKKTESGYLENLPLRAREQGAFIFTKPRALRWKQCALLKVDILGTDYKATKGQMPISDLSNPFDSIKAKVLVPLTLMMQIMDERFASPCLPLEEASRAQARTGGDQARASSKNPSR